MDKFFNLPNLSPAFNMNSFKSENKFLLAEKVYKSLNTGKSFNDLN